MTRLAAILLALGALVAGCSSSTPCTVIRDCNSAQRCVSGTCVDPGGQPPSAVGEACRSNADCASGLTCELPAQGFAGGFCTAACTGNSGCATGSACTPVAAAQLCTPTCTSDSQCRQDYGCCASLGNVCVPVAACTPLACMRPVVTSALASGQVQQFGAHKVNDTITFHVPPGTGSVTIVQQAQLATLNVTYKGQVIDNSAVPLTITQPDGGVVYDDRTAGTDSSPDGGVDPSGNYSFYGGGTPSTAAFTIPNTSTSLTAGVPAGDWKFVVNDYAYECTILSGCSDGGTTENTYDVSVVTRGTAGSTLDVAFYVVTTQLDANAASNPSVQRMVQSYKSVFSKVGITVNASFFNASATDKARFGTNISATATGPCDELSQMFLLSGANPGNTMNVFLVQSLQDANGQSGGTIVGIDGTIPGPASYNGTVQSGAVVSAADLFAGSSNCTGAPNLFCGADEVGYIAAHETGHFLGLFHTTEQGGADFDPLTDTGKCPCLSCASAVDRPKCGTTGANAPFITADRCVNPAAGCAGGDNLMFWFLQQNISSGALSTQQSQIMRLNPLVH